MTEGLGEIAEEFPGVRMDLFGSKPSGVARLHRDSYSSCAPSSRPCLARLSTSQKLHSRKAPSPPGSPVVETILGSLKEMTFRMGRGAVRDLEHAVVR